MHHAPKRRHIVFAFHLVRQLQQPVKHSRNHVALGDLVSVNALQRAFRSPFVHQHHRMAHVKRGGRPDIHRSVIQRSLRDMDIVVVRHDAQEHEQAARRSRRIVGVRVWQIPANPFRPPCGAGSVEHERACGEIFGAAGGLAGQQVLERLAAFNLPH